MIVLFVAVLLLVGCLPLFMAQKLDETADERPQTEIVRDTRPGVTNLVIDSDAGDVSVGAGPDDTIRIARVMRWTGAAKPEVTEEVVGDTLRITARCPSGDGVQCVVDIMVTLPVGGSVDALVGAGDVTVDGLAGAQKLVTSAGNVIGKGLRAARVEVRSSAGEITLAFAAAPSDVDVQGVAGDVQVLLPEGAGYAVDADSAVGEVMVTVRKDANAPHRINARTTSGDVMIVDGG